MVWTVDWDLVAAAVFGILVLYFMGRVFYYPLKFLGRALLQLLGGGLIIMLYNLVAGNWDLTIGLNPASICIVGFMGLPGLTVLVILRHLIGI